MGPPKPTFRLTFLSAFTALLVTLAWTTYARATPGIYQQRPSGRDYPDLYEASISELQDGLERGLFTSVELVKAYFARIEEVNLQGPALRAVIETNPSAMEQAAALDLERSRSGRRGPLHGIPILVKDNIATDASEGMNTTAGSFALLGSVVPRDAHVVALLRQAGAILLGKANLSEFAHGRGDTPNGWSGRGGQGTSPYVPLGDPSGSSSGCAIATAIGLAAGCFGTETGGSIISPSNFNNLVGIKPTVGLTSRAGVIPLSSHQDTVGPLARSVADAAVLLSAIAGPDPRDNYTLAQPQDVPDFTQALKADSLQGVRLGVPRKVFASLDAHIIAAFNATLDIIRELGATIVDPADLPDFEELEASDNQTTVVFTDFKIDLNRYIEELLEVPTGIKNVEDLVAFNFEHADQELPQPFWTDQSGLIQAQNTTGVNQAYYEAVAFDYELGGARGIDAALQAFQLDALLSPSNLAAGPAAIVGYPVVIVPLGFLPPDTPLAEANPIRETGPNQPFGLSEFELISYAFSYEQATHARLKMLAYPEAIPKTQLRDVLAEM
ncbi:amidase signature enzyme [Daedaleopsis nitida]|nr:amidase signature enzyme [Daedaleopsis nitida]